MAVKSPSTLAVGGSFYNSSAEYPQYILNISDGILMSDIDLFIPDKI